MDELMSELKFPATATPAQSVPTVSHLLGEMTWLLSQSPIHRVLAIADLEWLVMPALLVEQFYLFRDGSQPVGLALWAQTDAAGEAKLNRGMIEPENRLTMDEWSKGDRLWLVDLIAPFASAANQQREIMVADLISGPLRGRGFKFHQTDPATGARTVRDVAADAGDRLADVIKNAVEAQ
jgi:cytolysin-activating lysine-acyltransferase